jgi:hypothetical protein
MLQKKKKMQTGKEFKPIPLSEARLCDSSVNLLINPMTSSPLNIIALQTRLPTHGLRRIQSNYSREEIFSLEQKRVTCYNRT